MQLVVWKRWQQWCNPTRFSELCARTQAHRKTHATEPEARPLQLRGNYHNYPSAQDYPRSLIDMNNTKQKTHCHHNKQTFLIIFSGIIAICCDIYIYIYIYIHTHTHTHTNIYIYMCVCVCIYIYIYTHTTHAKLCAQNVDIGYTRRVRKVKIHHV